MWLARRPQHIGRLEADAVDGHGRHRLDSNPRTDVILRVRVLTGPSTTLTLKPFRLGTGMSNGLIAGRIRSVRPLPARQILLSSNRPRWSRSLDDDFPRGAARGFSRLRAMPPAASKR